MSFTAFLKQDSPFFGLFPGGIPIESDTPTLVTVQSEKDEAAGLGPREEKAYFVAWEKLSTDLKLDTAALLTQLEGGDTAAFLNYMYNGGKLPMRVSQVEGTTAA
jgi:hypothetical protein